jgi:hypothetical protein
MRRRAFISLLCGAAGWPLAARAQQKIARLGFVSWQAPTRIEDLRQGLRELGYVEGKNIEIESTSSMAIGNAPKMLSGHLSKRASISLSCGQRLQHTLPRR